MQAFFTHPVYLPPMTENQGQHLRRLREAAGLSIRELARQLDEDHSNVRYWERTGSLPRSNVLIPMAKALGVTVEELLGQPRSRKATPPAGRLRQLFETAAKLPRAKQEMILKMLEPFVREHAKEEAAAH
jgi:transcriptional regulator with XRE-family HTH domain